NQCFGWLDSDANHGDGVWFKPFGLVLSTPWTSSRLVGVGAADIYDRGN
ncbi:MAG: hypothetical protein ACD_58C00320G0003, partial [uncultured bacterium]